MNARPSGLHIIQLEVENVKRIKVARIRPNGSAVVRIKGNNEQGKTSLIDSIAMALGGKDLCPDNPVRTGEREAESKVTLGTNGVAEFVVTRKWNEKGTHLLVQGADGSTLKSPQSLLNGLVGKLSFDPLEFARALPRDQAEILRKLVGLDFEAHDKEREAVYAQRTAVNREVDSARAILNSRPVIDMTELHPVDLGALLRDESVAQKKIDEATAAVAELAHVGESIERLGRNIADAQATISRNAKEVDRLLAEIERLKQASADKERDIASFEKERGELRKQNVEEQLAAAHAKAKDARDEKAAVRERIAGADVINAKIRSRKERIDEQERLHSKGKESKALTDELDRLDMAKAKKISEAKYPVPGLRYSPAGVLVDGIPFEEASHAQKVRVSLAIGLAINPTLKVLLIREASFLDEHSLELVAQMAEQHGAQVWLELVGKDGPPGFVIEDGEVMGAAARADSIPLSAVPDFA